MKKILTALTSDAELVSKELASILEKSDPDYGVLYSSMCYSALTTSGKRIRPFLTIEFSRALGGNDEKSLPLAAAVEMVHTYSLIHDDLPCMDNDDIRRGMPTNHKVYGEAMACLAGDALLTDAFTVASNAELEPKAVLEAIRILSECAGSLGMVGGQVLDIKAEERECTEQEILDIQKRKTGCLINAACAMGAVAGGCSEDQFDAACRFAAGLGLAFQIRDDMLDVIGTKEEMGKGVGTDAVKNTFVRLYGLDKCEELVQRYTNVAIDALNVFDDTDYMIALAKSLTDRRN